MSFKTFELDIADGIAHIRFNRPAKLNIMTLEFWQEMVDVFAEIEDRTEARVVVISSTGKHFSAGIDLQSLAGMAAKIQEGDPGRARERLRRTVLELQESFNVIERCRAPVLVAVHGGCIGGAIDLISACDVRYCTADAWFCIQELNVGMVADLGTLQRLPHLIPAGKVRELAYTGRRMPADEALSIGLVNQVFEDAEALLAGVMKVAAEIASKSPLSVQGTKEMLNYTRDHSVADGLNYIAAWNAGMLFSADIMEGVKAVMSKQQPTYADTLPPQRLVRPKG